MTKFQVFLFGTFLVFIVVGVFIFSNYRGDSEGSVPVVVWGTLPTNTFQSAVQVSGLYQNESYSVTYVEKSEDSIDADFIEALASGSGPDLFLLPSNKIILHRNKIYALPYDLITERDFKDYFIEGSEIYMTPEGVVGLPLLVDPLVMYWNRDIFTDVGLVATPKYWDEFFDLAAKISVKDGALNVSRSAVAFGEYANIANAKDIVLNLALQAGTPITIWENGKVRSVFAESLGKPTVPGDAAVNFYTEFSNPSKASYSWNRALPNSTNFFLAGDLALYFGFASEIGTLQLKNPNLNFDVASTPLSREGGVNVSLGNYLGVSVVKASKNPAAAYAVASILAGTDSVKALSQALDLPPARRDLLSERQVSAHRSVFYTSAIRSRSWLDPSPKVSNTIFKDMIESITSGRARAGEAVTRVERELNALFNK